MPSIKTKHVNLYIAGCKTRRRGKGYLWTDESRFKNHPMSYFIKDPPEIVEDMKLWGISDQGVTYFQHGGIWHAKAVMGRAGYPNTADIFEEWLNGWASTLVPLIGEGVKLLTPGRSRLLIFHAAGWIREFRSYRKNYVELPRPDVCFLPNDDPDREKHLEGKTMCASLHWQHVRGGKPISQGRLVDMSVGQHTYRAVGEMTPLPKEVYAYVGWRPIDELHIVGDIEEPDTISTAMDFLFQASATQCQLPVFLTDN